MKGDAISLQAPFIAVFLSGLSSNVRHMMLVKTWLGTDICEAEKIA
jgi:hypothetical protein